MSHYYENECSENLDNHPEEDDETKEPDELDLELLEAQRELEREAKRNDPDRCPTLLEALGSDALLDRRLGEFHKNGDFTGEDGRELSLHDIQKMDLEDKEELMRVADKATHRNFIRNEIGSGRPIKPAVADDVPEVDWAQDLDQIKDEELRRTQIARAEKIQKMEANLNDRVRSGEISPEKAQQIYWDEIHPKRRSARTSAGMATVGLTWDDLGGLSDDGLLLSESHDAGEKLDEFAEKLNQMPLETRQKWLESARQNPEISDEVFKTLTRKIGRQT